MRNSILTYFKNPKKARDMIKAILIDDEEHSLATLQWKIEKFCPEVEIIGQFSDSEEGLTFLQEHTPDILFLDIEMPRLNGFEVLEAYGKEVLFDVIFTTAYDEFGIRAIKFSALDYLLKPIQNQELQAAIAKHKQKKAHHISPNQLDVLFSNIEEEKRGGRSPHIALSTKESIEFIRPEEIVACSSDSNYTNVFLLDGRKKLISRTLKDFEDLLKDYHFFRIHHSHLINLNYIREFIRADGGYIIMENKMNFPVSRSRREALLELFK